MVANQLAELMSTPLPGIGLERRVPYNSFAVGGKDSACKHNQSSRNLSFEATLQLQTNSDRCRQFLESVSPTWRRPTTSELTDSGLLPGSDPLPHDFSSGLWPIKT